MTPEDEPADKGEIEALTQQAAYLFFALFERHVGRTQRLDRLIAEPLDEGNGVLLGRESAARALGDPPMDNHNMATVASATTNRRDLDGRRPIRALASSRGPGPISYCILIPVSDSIALPPRPIGAGSGQGSIYAAAPLTPPAHDEFANQARRFPAATGGLIK